MIQIIEIQDMVTLLLKKIMSMSHQEEPENQTKPNKKSMKNPEDDMTLLTKKN